MRIFHSYGDVTITGEGLQSSEGSLACHTNCDTGHPFIMVISEDPTFRVRGEHSNPLSNMRNENPIIIFTGYLWFFS